jgi:hypothetical protein
LSRTNWATLKEMVNPWSRKASKRGSINSSCPELENKKKNLRKSRNVHWWRSILRCLFANLF